MKHSDFILSKNYSLNDILKKPEYFTFRFFLFQTHFPQDKKHPLIHAGIFYNKPANRQ